MCIRDRIGAGLGAATGAMLKKGKKHLSDDYDYSNWREDFKAMEYEFIDIIEAEPLVTEASFEINPQKHREEVKAKKIRDRTKAGDEGSEIAKKKVKGPKLMGEEVDKRRAPAELVARLSSRREGEMAQDGPNKPAYDAKQRLLAKAKAKRMGEEVEQIDEIAPLIGGVAKVGAVAAKVAAKGAAKAAPIVAKGAIKGAKVTGKAISKGAKTVSKIGRKVNKAVDTADKATDVALKMKELDRREKVGEEFESIDELKCWKGYKRKKGAVPGAKGSCVKESEVTEAKDETEIGITGQPIPKKKRSPKKQYEFEKKRRENLGRNVGGKTYSADVAPYKTNPRVGYLRNEYEMENEIDEAKHTPTKSDLEANIGGGNLQKLSKKASKRIDYDVDGDVDPQDKVEKSKGEYGEELPTPFGKFRTGDSKKVKVKKEEVSNWRDELLEESTKKYCPKCKKIETKSQCAYGPKYWEDNAEEIENGGESGGVSEGAAWTKKSGKSESGGLNEKGRKSYERENPGSDLKAPSKKVGNPRRKSFCARMKGMKKKLTSSKTANDPDSRINKSLRAWNC